MDHDSPEYRAHQARCIHCRRPGTPISRSQHRPHTLGPDCWCIGSNSVMKVCELDRQEWQNLPEVTYI